MIDYRTHVAALYEFRDALSARHFTDARLAAIRDQHLSDISKAPEMAVLGSLVDHLFWHASSDGQELALLESAASLWRDGLSIYAQLNEIRSKLEAALGDPSSPGSTQKFDSAMVQLKEMRTTVEGKQTDVVTLRDKIYDAAFPGAHPRQRNKPLLEWGWSDIVLARRTDALARSIRQHASDVPSSAFAFGVLSGYGANVCGSAFLGQVVGGPRRSHRHRDRLARNTVGSWFARSYSTVSSLTDILAKIRFGGSTPALPAVILQQVEAALADTYDFGQTPPMPDLQLGYRRLLRHLEALNSFLLPAPPPLPIDPFLTKIYGSTGEPTASMREMGALVEAQTASGSGSGGVGTKNVPTSSPGVSSQDSRRSSKLDCGAGFMALFRLIALSAVFFAECWEDWGNNKSCKLWEDCKDDFSEWWRTLWAGQSAAPGENVGATGQMLVEASKQKGVLEMIKNFYETHNQLYESLNAAYGYLCVCGLIYPDALLDRELYRQFLSVPSDPAGWPHLPEAESAESAHAYPTTAIELPAGDVAYPPGSRPDVIFTSAPGIGGAAASKVSGDVWYQTATGVLDARNRDLDADRGILHPCWKAVGSIDDAPLAVIALDYSET